MHKLTFCVLLALITATLTAADPVPRIRAAPFISGLKNPVALSDDGSGRLFIVEQEGRIRIWTKQQLLPKPFLDITDRVKSGGECGLLSMAFHPDFKTNGRFFVNYTTDKKGKLETVISEFKADPKVSEAGMDEREIMRFAQPYSNHNGGQIAFGPDGMLYIGNGDGGSGGDPHNYGQQLSTLLGKILRIDVNGKQPYAVPADNPFIKQAGARPEIWAYGLRNPWRFSFDKKTGELYAADVGQNKWEEIDIVKKGKNYGWSAKEAAAPFKPDRANGELVNPIKSYGRDQGVSVTGGFVYRGKDIPALQGVYLYADFATGRVWGLKWEAGSLKFNAELLKLPIQISAFGEDKDGELYLCDHVGGKIFRIGAN